MEIHGQQNMKPLQIMKTQWSDQNVTEVEDRKQILWLQYWATFVLKLNSGKDEETYP